jgi:plasmid stabilization system protein ParE
MEKAASRPNYENLPPEELAAMREVLRELASDLPGTMRRVAEQDPEAARQYREAAQSCVDARLDMPYDHR